MDLLQDDELEGVIAHEIGHAKHWDMWSCAEKVDTQLSRQSPVLIVHRGEVVQL
jgi:beta-lactamase regulating signal transducer with metallopeptidase domain